MVIFKPYLPTVEKLDFIAGKMRSSPLWLSDEYRTEEYIWKYVMPKYAGTQDGCVIREIGDFQGILCISNIISGFKGNVNLKIWGKDNWGHQGIKEAKTILRETMKGFSLARLGTETADSKMAKLAELVGFFDEGIIKDGFRWNGKLYDTILMGLYPQGGRDV